jgi:hypothetical protein
MGLRFRGKSGSKTSWFNYSASKRGFNLSSSVKLDDNFTINIGKNAIRKTINLGGGFSYVTQSKLGKASWGGTLKLAIAAFIVIVFFIIIA